MMYKNLTQDAAKQPVEFEQAISYVTKIKVWDLGVLYLAR